MARGSALNALPGAVLVLATILTGKPRLLSQKCSECSPSTIGILMEKPKLEQASSKSPNVNQTTGGQSEAVVQRAMIEGLAGSRVTDTRTRVRTQKHPA